MNICANLVRLIHLIVILCVLLIPFSKNKYLLNLYVMIVPFILFHWSVNDDTCFLTVLECYLRNTPDKKKTFMHSVISPIYKIDNNIIGILTKSILLALYYYVLVTTNRLAIFPSQIQRL